MMMSRPASRWYALILAAALTLALNPRAARIPAGNSRSPRSPASSPGRPLAAALARAGEELVPVSGARAARPRLHRPFGRLCAGLPTAWP